MLPIKRIECFEPIKYPLINRFYKQYEKGTKIKGDEVGWVWLDDRNEIIAVLRLRKGEQNWMRSVLVAPALRGQGLGCAFVSAVLKQCDQPVVCFCEPRLIRFYEQCNMIEVTPDTLTPALKAKWQGYYDSHHRFSVLYIK